MVDQIDNNPDLIADFVEESLDSLRQVPNDLTEYRSNPKNPDPINAVFRAIHSIKGSASFLGLSAIKTFSHTLENTLDEVRKEQVTLTEELERHFIEGFDILDEFLNQAIDGDISENIGQREQDLLHKVESIAAGCRCEMTREEKLIQEITSVIDNMLATDNQQMGDYTNSLLGIIADYQEQNIDQKDKPLQTPDALKSTRYEFAGTDLTDRVYSLLEMFIVCDQGDYQDDVGTQFSTRIEELIHWATQNSHDNLASTLTKIATDFRTLFESPLDIDSLLLSVIWEKMEPALVSLQKVDAEITNKPDVEVEEAEKKKPSGAQNHRSHVVRIKEEVVDGFLNDVSSLFITCELFKDLQSRMVETGEIAHFVEEMRQINHQFVAQSTDLQRSVVTLRRVAVSGLFSKFPRMARGLATQLNKKVNICLVGEEVEIDKTLCEDLDAPLTHMIRNSMDHGIDTPEERIARGAPEVGTLTLTAELSRTHVIISIHDDGRGIDPNILRKKAVEKGIYTAEQAAALTDQKAIELVFHAGLSTATEISDVSGRGVGMDVVRTTLLEHDGNVTVKSEIGVGTTFRIEIPIREAVLVTEGLLLQTEGETYVLPFEFVKEITELDATDLKPVQGVRVAVIRGNTYAATSLGDLLSSSSKTETVLDGKRQAILVGCKNGDLCLLVDQVLGHRQVVINSIKDIIPENNNIAGVAQLGGGRLALVLSVEDIVQAV